MEVASANEDTIEAAIGVNPTGKVKSGFNEQELAVRVPNTNGEVGEVSRYFKEEENGEPLVVEIVTVTELAVEVRELIGAETRGFGEGREGESEGLVLPYIV